jgi:DMSO/TMAO reductase YedYZ molybdopterin-dependent catalytic subunit
MIATRYEGLPILPSHGCPARLLVPHLYFWKSGKWVCRLRFPEKDEPGFWESHGYICMAIPSVIRSLASRENKPRVPTSASRCGAGKIL